MDHMVKVGRGIRADGSARRALTDDVLTHLLAGGRLDESLRTTASAIGAGHSLLLYHFGSREEMLRSVHAACEERQRAHFADLRLRTEDPFEAMRAMWAHVADPRMWPIYRLGFSLRARDAASTPPGGGAVTDDEDRTRWLADLVPMVRMLGIDEDRAVDEAMLWLATTRGLLWELVTGADPALVERAAEAFLARLVAAARPGSATP
jgi:AcrR family transcriptional regulator